MEIRLIPLGHMQVNLQFQEIMNLKIYQCLEILIIF